jgi:methyltransferase
MSLTVIVIVFLLMLIELRLSRSNEQSLKAQGALEPRDDVYRLMAWAYPVSFVAMALEGGVVGPPPAIVFATGVVVFAVAKAIKYWAVASLGRRWTFRVLVVRGAPLVTHGPYAWLRHPNYVGVIGELVGVALLVGAPVTGMVATLGFIYLLRRRIAVENHALGRDQPIQRGV